MDFVNTHIRVTWLSANTLLSICIAVGSCPIQFS